MGSKNLHSRKENDPKWIKNIAYYTSPLEGEEKKKYNKELRELYLEYIRNGLKPNIAFKKAIRVLESFKY